jgi:hypothetical protein
MCSTRFLFPSLLTPLPRIALIKPLCRIILWAYRQSFPFTRCLIRDLHDVNQLLLFCDCKINLIVVACAKVDLNMLVAPEKHDGTWIIELIHGVEIRHQGVIDSVDYGKVFNHIGNLVEVFILGEG